MILIAYVLLTKVSNGKISQKNNFKISVVQPMCFMWSQVGNWGLPLFHDPEAQTLFNLNHQHIKKWLITPILSTPSWKFYILFPLTFHWQKLSYMTLSKPKGSGKHSIPRHPKRWEMDMNKHLQPLSQMYICFQQATRGITLTNMEAF